MGKGQGVGLSGFLTKGFVAYLVYITIGGFVLWSTELQLIFWLLAGIWVLRN